MLETVCTVSPVDDASMESLAEMLGLFRFLRGARSLALADARYLARGRYRTAYCAIVLTQALRPGGSRWDGFDHGIREAYQLALADLAVDLGHVMIRPSALADKLADFFTRRWIRFRDYPRFLWKYHLVAEDEEEVSRVFRWGFPDVVSRYNGLLIEIMSKKLVVMTRKVLNVVDALDLVEASFALQDTIR